MNDQNIDDSGYLVLSKDTTAIQKKPKLMVEEDVYGLGVAEMNFPEMEMGQFSFGLGLNF